MATANTVKLLSKTPSPVSPGHNSTNPSFRTSFAARGEIRNPANMGWLHNCSPFTIYRLLFSFSMLYALCSMPPNLARKDQVSGTLIKSHLLSHSILARCSIFLNSGSPVRIIAFSRLAVATAKQSANDRGYFAFIRAASMTS